MFKGMAELLVEFPEDSSFKAQIPVHIETDAKRSEQVQNLATDKKSIILLKSS